MTSKKISAAEVKFENVGKTFGEKHALTSINFLVYHKNFTISKLNLNRSIVDSIV